MFNILTTLTKRVFKNSYDHDLHDNLKEKKKNSISLTLVTTVLMHILSSLNDTYIMHFLDLEQLMHIQLSKASFLASHGHWYE